MTIFWINRRNERANAGRFADRWPSSSVDHPLHL